MYSVAFAIIVLALSVMTVGLAFLQTYDRYQRLEEQRGRERETLLSHTQNPRVDGLLSGIMFALATQPEEQIEAWYESIVGEQYRED